MANANNKGMQYYTIPSASNSKAGHPLLLKATTFRTFTTADMLSLCFTLTSVVVILSIMTSRMQEQDFRRSLPLKLVLGLTTLFFAVAAMIVACDTEEATLGWNSNLHNRLLCSHYFYCTSVPALSQYFLVYSEWYPTGSFIDSVRVSSLLGNVWFSALDWALAVLRFSYAYDICLLPLFYVSRCAFCFCSSNYV